MSTLFIRCLAVAVVGVAGPALAQSMPMNMPGMSVPAPPKQHAKVARTKAGNSRHKKTATKKPRKEAFSNAHSAPPTQSNPAATMTMPIGSQTSGGAMTMPMGSQTGSAMDMPMPPQGGQSSGMGAMTMAQPATGHGAMEMGAALGSYPGQRESSGTAWQPDASTPMSGPMIMSGGWMLMAHGDLNLVYDHQSGPRGGNKAFASGMLMTMASHPLGNGTVQFRTMVSPDPLMGPAGYPLLLQTGETANGRTPLIDRQHPHDLFMEMSAAVSQNLGRKSSLFLYGALPGEPAFGPPAFMHRESIEDSPEAPITHHWLDSTHISFGVLTAGLVLDRMKLEVSRFNGREPDQHRWNIETGPLDSTSVRLSWNPTRTLALQGSWGNFVSPEQLEPGVDQKRWSASALWADDLAPEWHAAATLAWGRKTVEHHSDDAFAAEASLKHFGWILFGRGEMVDNRELLGLEEQGPPFRVGKLSLGAVRDFRVADHLSLGAGGLFSLNFVPDALAPLYGSHHPTGTMAFMRLKLN